MEPRAWRALTALGLAAAVVAAVGLTYLRPWQGLAPTRVAPQRAAPARQVSVQQMQFLSATQGWVVTGDASSSTLFHTTDGGRRWQRQLDGVTGEGWALRFFDARRGVVYARDRLGPALWRTADGGQHWTRTIVPKPTAPSLIFFADPSHGWWLAPLADLPPFTGPIVDRQDVALFRTADGGANWSQVLRTDQPQASHGLNGDGLKMSIWFRDLNGGWIGQTTPGEHAVVYATTDGGDDWIRQELPPPAAGWGSPLGVVLQGPPTPSDTSSGVLVATPISQGPGQGTYLLQSGYVYTRQAASWAVPTPLPHSGFAFSVVGHTEGRRWWVSNGSTVLESDDSGDHWQPLGEGPNGRIFARFDVVDPGHAWALLLDARACGPGLPCPSSLARTADGGRHWTLVSTPP